MAGRHTRGQSARSRCAVQTKAISLAHRSRQGNHRRPLEWATILRFAQETTGGESWLEVTALPKRCAIYTRKSSEEGLEQNFNSLHAQRQACEAFVRSQASEGWRLVKTHYEALHQPE